MVQVDADCRAEAFSSFLLNIYIYIYISFFFSSLLAAFISHSHLLICSAFFFFYSNALPQKHEKTSKRFAGFVALTHRLSFRVY